MIIIYSEGDRDARFPWFTLGLIAVNLIVFAAQKILGDEATEGMALVPKEIVTGKDIVGVQKIILEEEIADDTNRDARGRPLRKVIKEEIEVRHYPGPVPIYMTLLTSMFMHAGWAHLIGNLWFLWVFGRNVEHAMDHALFLVFYLVCGLGAAFVHIAFDPQSFIPCLGASGAISGVMAAYASVYPFNTVKMWFGPLIGVIELPAMFVVGGWIALQWIYGAMELTNPNGVGGVAYGAHLGGFGAGFAFVWITIAVLKLQQQQRAEMPDVVAPYADDPRPPQAGDFPHPPVDVYDFGQFYARPPDSQANQAGVSGPRPVDLGEFYPKR